MSILKIYYYISRSTILFLFFIIIILETIKSESIGYQTVLNSIQNKNTGNKVPFLANIPVHHMMLNYMDGEIKNNSFSEINSCSHV